MFCLDARQPCLLVVSISVCHGSMWLARSRKASLQLPRGFYCAAHAGCRSVSRRSSLHRALGVWFSLDCSLIAMVRASVGSSWRACAPMSLPCFFLWLEFEVAAGPGLRSLDHSEPWCPLSSSSASCKALKSTPAMLHIPALKAELVTFVLPPNSIPEHQRSFQQFQDLRRLSALEELLLLLPMCRVCCSHCLLLL